MWLVLCLVLFAFHIPALLRLAVLEPFETRGLLLMGSVLALAPFGTGFALGQLAVASITLLVIAIDRIERGASKSGAMLLALATMLKPQIAAWFIAYYLVRDGRRAALFAAAIVIIATAAGVAVLAMNDVNWVSTWTSNSRSELVGGGLDPAGPLSAQLVDLRPLFAAMGLSSASAWLGLAFALAILTALYYWGRRLDRRYEPLLLANVAVVLLFVGYHRFYDAAVLCLPVAWAIGAMRNDSALRGPALAAASCCIPFFVPGAWLLQTLANDGTISALVAQTSYWNALVLRHQIWSLLFLQIVLLVALKAAAGSARHHPDASLSAR